MSSWLTVWVMLTFTTADPCFSTSSVKSGRSLAEENTEKEIRKKAHSNFFIF